MQDADFQSPGAVGLSQTALFYSHKRGAGAEAQTTAAVLRMKDCTMQTVNKVHNLNIKNIGMPSGVTICASFNKELSEAIGCVIGEEAKTLGMPLVLAPAFNIHRNPLNGRQPEYFSEDPYLSGVMAGFYAKGLEGAGVGGCYKHFIGNNCESSRKRNQSLISERAIREIYFRTFEYAMVNDIGF